MSSKYLRWGCLGMYRSLRFGMHLKLKMMNLEWPSCLFCFPEAYSVSFYSINLKKSLATWKKAALLLLIAYTNNSCPI
jgi:hypothetical protein